ncbi:EMB2654 [Symbiodinium sp. KB8]|nr:EMB2654 [Symbiodinium sp. KB8]
MASTMKMRHHWAVVLLLLEELPLVKLTPDDVVHSTALKALVQNHRWEQAKCVLGQILSDGSEIDAAALTTSGCAADVGERWRAAAKLFTRMQKHGLRIDSVAGCVAVSASHWEQASCLLMVLEFHSVESNLQVCNAAAVTLDRVKQWQRVVAFTSRLGRSVCDDLTLASVVRAHSESSWHRTLTILALCHSSGTRCLPAVLDSCAAAREWPKSLMLLSRWRGMSMRTDAATRNGILRAANPNNWIHTLSALQRLVTQGSEYNLMHFVAAEAAMDDCGAWFESLELYRSSVQMSLGPTLETCSLALRSRSRAWQQALWIFAEAESSRVKLDSIVFNTLITTLEPENWRRALDVFSSRSSQLNSVSHRATMRALSSVSSASGEIWQLAVKIFRNLGKVRMSIDSASCVAAIEAFGCNQQWRQVGVLLSNQANSNVLTDVPMRNAVVTCCTRASHWNHALSLFYASGLGLVPDIVSYGAAISACEASSSWHSALALHMRMLMQRLQVSTIAQGALMNSVSSESKWQLTLLCLAELDHQKMAHNGAFSACERVSCWHQALQLLQGLSLRHLQVEASSFNSVVSSCGKASGKWETALEVLRSMPLYMAKPDLLTYDTAMMTCIRCGETQAALDTLSEHEGLRSPLSYLWSLSVMCASDPAVVERACVNAGDVASWQEAADSALFLYSTALLGAHSQIHTAAARHALERIRSLSLDMLVMCCWGAIGLHGSENLMAASVARAQHMLAFVGRTTSLHTYDFEKSGIKLLGVVFACRLSRCLPARFYASVRGLLLRVGQDLDAKASASESMQLIPPRAEKAMPRAARPSVLVDLPDRAAMYKPRAWEVYGGHSRLQLVAFAQDRFGDRQIFRDASHHHGFLHRLDVPSSGLVVVSKTFEAFYDLQLQLHAGRVCRSSGTEMGLAFQVDEEDQAVHSCAVPAATSFIGTAVSSPLSSKLDADMQIEQPGLCDGIAGGDLDWNKHAASEESFGFTDRPHL